ncbi:sensor domain-containing diguanylate cyclase [Sodalis sp. dw_96]|uniref:sensor domain-containing diguanylate cyclase n=1 Tax=Sodalis sp. dw_96 TaxID=2719794 RepID=UPI0021083808|nr:sensor domain-containing diguanylate cyclase [Sodalis sp. dw_96]
MDLRRLILILAVMSALITLSNAFFATYKVQRQLLIDGTLEANRVYAAKLADTTNLFFESIDHQLAYSSAILSTGFDNPNLLQAEAQRLLLQTNSFNSVAVVDADGVVLATSPDSIQIKGRKLTSPGAIQALRVRSAKISEPYISVTGNLVIFISSPIFSEGGTYLGYVGGTIYLKQKSILNELLGQNFHAANIYTYVINDEQKIIYHDDAARVGQPMAHGGLSEAMRRRDSGSLQEVNRSGIDILAGFAREPLSHWSIITIRTTDNTLMSLQGLMLSVLHRTLPLTLLTLTAAWLFARLISKPLWLLARSANDMDRTGISEDITRIPSWYFEVAQLKRAMLVGIGLLQQRIGTLNTEAQTDPLTGLLNRRGMSLTLDALSAAKQNFAAIALDIDMFKQVNDTYGHDVGDEVIKFLAQQLRACSREDDIVCRSGGEEFLMLLPDTPRGSAAEIAERLRSTIAAADFPTVGQVSISAGVALWTPETGNPEQALKQADDALYRAKAQGRNRVVVA